MKTRSEENSCRTDERFVIFISYKVQHTLRYIYLQPMSNHWIDFSNILLVYISSDAVVGYARNVYNQSNFSKHFPSILAFVPHHQYPKWRNNQQKIEITKSNIAYNLWTLQYTHTYISITIIHFGVFSNPFCVQSQLPLS